MSKKKSTYKRLALTFSLCLILIWGLLGTSASLAWFADTSPKVQNIFHFAEFDLEVSYRTAEMDKYSKIESDTKIFDENALYEPGYVQVVYLQVENKGTVPFDLKTAVTVTDYTPSVSVLGQVLNLQEHLRFGLVMADSDAELVQKVAPRAAAKAVSTMPLNNYYEQPAELAAKDTTYIALIVRVPEEIGNEANAAIKAGYPVPEVELGLIVSVMQKTK